MATTLDREVQVAHERKGSPRKLGRWGVGILAAVALAAVTVAAVAVLWPSPQAPAPTTHQQVAATGSLYTPQEQKVMSLANAGLIPRETLDGGIYRLKSLVNQGLIPRETVESSGPVEPLYTAQEQKVMSLAYAGLIPRETLNGEPYRTKSLINQGLIPREAADS